MDLVSRRHMIKSALTVPAAAMLVRGSAEPRSITTPTKLANAGWVWEGQGLNAPVTPSVFGIGDGADYFGLRKAVYMFHPNNEMAMEQLRDLEEVICDITKWTSSACDYSCVQLHRDQSLRSRGRRRMQDEAKIVGALALTYRNIKGAYYDDTLGNSKKNPCSVSAEEYSLIHTELEDANPELKLWALVSAEQLYEQDWAGYRPHMDVIDLRVWKSHELRNLDRHTRLCREIFPDKPIVLGCSLWDYSSDGPMPLDVLRRQWRRVLDYVVTGKIAGYSILGAYLIDSAVKQARWVRDFIAAN